MFTKRPLLLVLVALAAVPARADERADRPLEAKALAHVREWTRLLAGDVERLQEDVIEFLEGDQERRLYRGADAVLTELRHFQGSLKEGTGREKLFTQFAAVDTKLHSLVSDIEALGVQAHRLRRAARRVTRTDLQLNYILFEAEKAENRVRQLIQGQAEALALETDDLVQSAKSALAKVEGEAVLQDNLRKLAAAAQHFNKIVQDGSSREQARRAFADVSTAWTPVAEAIRDMKPEENLSLLRTFQRIDTIMERLHRHVGADGKLTRYRMRA